MRYRKTIFLFLSVVLVVSAFLKLFSISYVSEVLFVLLPVAWLDSFLATNLSLVVIAVSIIELLLGGLLWTRYKEKALPIILSFLLVMLVFNSYQLYAGVEACGCFGSWLQIPPKLTALKTSLLIACCGYLMNVHQEFGSFNRLPIHQS